MLRSALLPTVTLSSLPCVCLSQGLLHLFVGENTAAQRNVASAADVYQEHLGADHPSTRDVQHVLRCINDAIMIGASEQGGSLPPMAADV